MDTASQPRPFPPRRSPRSAQTFSRQFLIRHVFRAGAIVWVKHKNQDYYVVFKSHSRPNRGVQLPGGRVEKNENPAECVLREVYEETGVESKIVCPLGFLHFENKEDSYSNMQTYFIVKPTKPIDPYKIWKHVDMDYSKQDLEVWCVPVGRNPSFLSVGQDRIVHMFRKWLRDHKRG